MFKKIVVILCLFFFISCSKNQSNEELKETNIFVRIKIYENNSQEDYSKIVTIKFKEEK